jgi:uncharacterized delta-60 repeat protein
MTKIYLLFAFLFFTICLDAQYKVNKKILTDIGIVNNGTVSMALQADGKIVVAGFVQEGDTYKPSVVRFRSNGELDAGFGKKGIDTFTVSRILPPTYQGAYFRSVTVQADGKILLAGSAWYVAGVNYLSNVLLMRLYANGAIDSSFGDNGTVRTNINSSTGLSVDEANDIKLQTDGKIVVAGQSYDYVQHRFLVVRYNADGSIDSNFGLGGPNLVAIGVSDDEALSLDIQSDGKIILAGKSYQSGGFSYRVALARFNTNGFLDNSFGTSGTVTTNLSSGADIANDVAVQADGKIVTGGYTFNTASSQNNILCIRYNSNGRVDSSFGSAGNVIVDVQGKDDAANNILLQPDNKILLGGYATGADNVNNFLSLRLKTDGTPDNSFGVNGIQTTSIFNQGDIAYSMSLLSNGKFLLAGQTNAGASKYISLARYKQNGITDSSFANQGRSITGVGSSDDVAYKMLNVPWDKSLLVAGTANGYWVLAKFNPRTLSLDSSFGVNGKISVNYKNPRDPQDKPSLAIDADSKKIYLAGYTGSGVTIVRFNKYGVQDKTFGNNGAVNYPVSIYYGGFGLQNDHKILIAGVRQTGTTGYDFVARLNVDGSVDSSFGTSGEVQHLPLTVNSIQMKNNDSSILLGGRVSVNFNGAVGVLAIKTNGSFDQSFGTNGLVYKQSSAANAQIFFRYNLTQDALGRILISGGVQGSNFKYQFSVTRFLEQGIVDSSFANKGLFVKDVSTGSFSDNSNEGISSYCVNGNCSILTCGIKLNDGNEQSNVVAILLKNDGTIDSLNHGNGYIDTSFFGDNYEAGYAALIDTIVQQKEVMFIAGKASNGNNSDFELIQLLKSVDAADVLPSTIVSTPDYHIKVTPNPVHNFLHLSYTLPQAANTEIKLTRFDGKLIMKTEQFTAAGFQQVLLRLPPSTVTGVYFISISTKQGINISKLLVQ